MPRPERRRRGDLIAAAALTVLALVAAVVVWRFSDAVATTSVTGPPGDPAPAEPATVPTTLSQAWQSPSSATPAPVTVESTVVTGDGSEVLGHDALTGALRWRYARDIPLCTVGAAWGRAVAVSRRGEFCSEVTTLDGGTGARGPQRNADLGLGARLLGNGALLAGTTPELVEVWRSDLVKTTEYGLTQAPEQPEKQPRTGCRYSSFAMVPGRLAVLELCPGEPTERLTVLKPDAAEADKPEPQFSTALPGRGGLLVAMTADLVAVAMPGPPRLLILDGTGALQQSYPLPDGELTGAAGPVATVRTDPRPVGGNDGGQLYWWSGAHTVALDGTELRPLWTVPGTLGTGLPFADGVLIPVPGALLVVDPERGTPLRSLPVDRPGRPGAVSLSSVGPVVLEQRGAELVALR